MTSALGQRYQAVTAEARPHPGQGRLQRRGPDDPDSDSTNRTRST